MHQQITSTEDQKSRSCPAKPRAVLTKSEVIAIFQTKLTHSPATKVARLYGVSEKAIRDIWKARTWAAETWHIDPSRALVVKTSGRPIGSRDSKPRKPRHALKDCCSPEKIVAAHTSLDVHQSVNVIYDTCRFNDQLGRDRSSSSDLLPRHRPSTSAVNQFNDCQHQLSEHIFSLDEQLFAWEHNSDRGTLPDPFEADWVHCRR